MLPKTGKFLPKGEGRAASGSAYAAVVALALRDELGDSHRAVKIVMRWTGASECTVKNWFAGTRGPRGEHLVSLVRHSDDVFRAFLRLTAREASTVAMNLKAVRSKLVEMLEMADELLDRD
jgi:hypothetical protein